MSFVSISKAQAKKMGLDVTGIPDEKKKSKYNNVRTECGQGHTHRSKKEASYCNDLALELRAGHIRKYEVEVKFVIMKGFEYRGERIREIAYIADFVVHRLDGKREIVDTKGVRTNVFKNKWKLMKKKFRTRHDIILKLA
ncbi:MAG: DUF1064 domain-containing protein [bacterium]